MIAIPCAPGTGRRKAVLLGGLGILLVGCGLEPRTRLLPNQPPEVMLDHPQVIRASDGSDRFGLSWKGRDPDGTVEHYLLTEDASLFERMGRGWTKTLETGTTVGIPRRAQAGRMVTSGRRQEEPQFFAVRAVDNDGNVSTPATMAFFGTNIAPDVAILDPDPTPSFWLPIYPITGTSLDIRWIGTDLDGRITKYKYRLFGENDPDLREIPNFIGWARAYPDSFRRLFAPGFIGWDSAGSDVQSTRYTGLTPNRYYLFVITAIDDAGDYAPVFSVGTNMLIFGVSGDAVPRICVASPVDFCPALGRDVDLHYEFSVEARVPVSWSATPPTGSTIDAYRWVLDPLDPSDDKQRSHPTADPNHWTPWSLDATSTAIGPFQSRADDRREHVLHIQARDTFHRVATFRLHFTLVRPTHERELLVVDDTRLAPDRRRPDGSLQPPTGDWPTAAELDTFLYAQGNHPWRGYPAGTLSPRGILSGYDFDTLGTRGLPAGIVPLSLLSRYRQVMWLTNDVGSTFTGSPIELLQPITSLRLMSSPGHMSTLSAYVAQGGRLWLCGGGAAYASLAAWQRRSTPPDVFTHADGELVQGRLMYDHAHWRSAVTLNTAQVAMLNDAAILRLFDPSRLTASPGRGWAGQPDYAKLRTALPYLTLRSRDDPAPPQREGGVQFWLFDYFTVEFLSQPNAILEDADPRPNRERLESALDTLYVAAGASAPPFAPVMTYYHGSEGGSVVFSGLPIWRFRPSQCATLVDFVLQDIWGLSRWSKVIASREK